MKITDEQEERCALIADGCKITQQEADKLYQEQIKVSKVAENHYSEKVARIRELATLQKMKSKRPVDRKSLAAGEQY